jgi:ribosomal protein S18 acetylase RimI-like enzyme
MAEPTRPTHVRARTPEDLDECLALVALVHDRDGYPSFVGEGGLITFVAPDDALGAWVALDDDGLVGNVMLRSRSAPPSVEIAARACGVAPEGLGFIARLVVAPRARRRGIAIQLLDVAVEDARGRGLVPVLDVVRSDAAAIALYTATGWQLLGDVRFTVRNGEQLELQVFAKP